MNVPFEDLTSLIQICTCQKGQRSGYLASLFPNLCVRPREHFRVEISISFAWDSLVVGLPSNLDLRRVRAGIGTCEVTYLLTSRKVNHLHLKRILYRPEVETREGTSPWLLRLSMLTSRRVGRWLMSLHAEDRFSR